MENATTEHVDNIVPGSRLLTEPDALSLGAAFIFSRSFRHGKVDFDAMCPVNRGAVFCFLLTATTKAEKRARVNRVEKESLWSYRSPSLDKEWLRKHELRPSGGLKFARK